MTIETYTRKLVKCDQGPVSKTKLRAITHARATRARAKALVLALRVCRLYEDC